MFDLSNKNKNFTLKLIDFLKINYKFYFLQKIKIKKIEMKNTVIL